MEAYRKGKRFFRSGRKIYNKYIKPLVQVAPDIYAAGQEVYGRRLKRKRPMSGPRGTIFLEGMDRYFRKRKRRPGRSRSKSSGRSKRIKYRARVGLRRGAKVILKNNRTGSVKVLRKKRKFRHSNSVRTKKQIANISLLSIFKRYARDFMHIRTEGMTAFGPGVRSFAQIRMYDHEWAFVVDNEYDMDIHNMFSRYPSDAHVITGATTWPQNFTQTSRSHYTAYDEMGVAAALRRTSQMGKWHFFNSYISMKCRNNSRKNVIIKMYCLKAKLDIPASNSTTTDSEFNPIALIAKRYDGYTSTQLGGFQVGGLGSNTGADSIVTNNPMATPASADYLFNKYYKVMHYQKWDLASGDEMTMSLKDKKHRVFNNHLLYYAHKNAYSPGVAAAYGCWMMKGDVACFIIAEGGLVHDSVGPTNISSASIDPAGTYSEQIDVEIKSHYKLYFEANVGMRKQIHDERGTVTSASEVGFMASAYEVTGN